MMFNYNIRFLREKNGIEQKEFAKLINISNTRYNHYENETDIIPLKYLIFICDYHNVSLDYIFNFTVLLNYSNSSSINLKLSGERLKELRTSKKLSQNKLSEILKYSISTISNYENSKQIISTSFLYDICKKYNISADYLLGKINTPKYLNHPKK